MIRLMPGLAFLMTDAKVLNFVSTSLLTAHFIARDFETEGEKPRCNRLLSRRRTSVRPGSLCTPERSPDFASPPLILGAEPPPNMVGQCDVTDQAG